MYPPDNRSKRSGGGMWLTELSQDELRTIAYEMPVEEVENNSEETTQEEPTTEPTTEPVSEETESPAQSTEQTTEEESEEFPIPDNINIPIDWIGYDEPSEDSRTNEAETETTAELDAYGFPVGATPAEIHSLLIEDGADASEIAEYADSHIKRIQRDRKAVENKKYKNTLDRRELKAAREERNALLEAADAELSKWNEVKNLSEQKAKEAIEEKLNAQQEERNALAEQKRQQADEQSNTEADTTADKNESPLSSVAENQAEVEAEEADTEVDATAEEAEIEQLETSKPTFIDAVRTIYEKGKGYASKLFGMKFFDVAETPEFMKQYGLRGDKFTIRYGVISRHFGKDSSHSLTEEEWAQLPDALRSPFAITKYDDKENGFRLYTELKNSKGEYIVVGVEVKNAGRELEVNAISTVFGRNKEANLTGKETIMYKSPKITPEQKSLLNDPNYHQYTKAQESDISEDKVNTSISDKQESETESSENENTENSNEDAEPNADENPNGNRLVSDERYEELKRRMRDKLRGQLNIGIDPEIIAIGAEMAIYHIERGARKFTEYASSMIADLGDSIRPYLKALYNAARDMPEAEELSSEMDSYESVKAIDVANFDQPTTNVIASAEMRTAEAIVEEDAEQINQIDAMLEEYSELINEYLEYEYNEEQPPVALEEMIDKAYSELEETLTEFFSQKDMTAEEARREALRLIHTTQSDVLDAQMRRTRKERIARFLQNSNLDNQETSTNSNEKAEKSKEENQEQEVKTQESEQEKPKEFRKPTRDKEDDNHILYRDAEDAQKPSVDMEEDEKYRIGDRQTFDSRQRKAVQDKGTVTPGLANMDFKIISVPLHNFRGTGNQAIDKARVWAFENLLGKHTAHKGTSNEFKYTIGEDVIRKYLSESSTKASDNLGIHLAVLKELKAIVNASIQVEVHADYKKGFERRSIENGLQSENMLMHRFFAAVTIGGELYRVKISLQEFKDKGLNQLYNYQVKELELLISGSTPSDALSNSSYISGAKLLKGVEKSYEPGKKILEESEKAV